MRSKEGQLEHTVGEDSAPAEINLRDHLDEGGFDGATHSSVGLVLIHREEKLRPYHAQ
jgi:hypothetical protein